MLSPHAGLSAGPAVMALGRHRRRWLVVTAVTFLVVALLSSAATWLPLVGSAG
ncbi:hypothetical protein [Auraticoccus monumenti]|uniref:Uncharacterized protein n=1 Tax=Auraticoccus monumenti TaxID=675864 RepID=A0A1G6ZX14_9ACTN|nr:hypothetical protein [Auraticoccus monumenti]SDE07070.1 hypothetical protein SAMN04489747_2430 [Auraticoccus monumenti]